MGTTDKNTKNLVTSICDRCGKCCFMFIHQIHYTPLQIKQLNVNKIDLPLFTWFLQNKEQFLKMENGKEKYFVPTKEEFKQKTNPQEFHELLTSQRQSNECIFLAWDANGFPECRIQEFKPQMCKDYPDNKGGACLNHKERYYSRAFFEFQKRTVDMPIKVLKEFYYGKLTDERAYDILSLLMDYGRFRKQKVQLFFQNEFNYSVQDFEKLCKELLHYNLISIYDDPEGFLIEGISMKEIEHAVDAIMKERGWIS